MEVSPSGSIVAEAWSPDGAAESRVNLCVVDPGETSLHPWGCAPARWHPEFLHELLSQAWVWSYVISFLSPPFALCCSYSLFLSASLPPI